MVLMGEGREAAWETSASKGHGQGRLQQAPHFGNLLLGSIVQGRAGGGEAGYLGAWLNCAWL